MKKYIIITADINDADYVTKKSEITDDQIEQIKPIISALQARRDKLNEDINRNWDRWRPNWETLELPQVGDPYSMYVDTGILTEEQVKLFEKFVPYDEYGIHTIESIEIITVEKEEKLF